MIFACTILTITASSPIHALDMSRVKTAISKNFKRYCALYSNPLMAIGSCGKQIDMRSDKQIKLTPPTTLDPALLPKDDTRLYVLNALKADFPDPVIALILEYAKPTTTDFKIDRKKIINIICGHHKSHTCEHEFNDLCPRSAIFHEHLFLGIHNPFFHRPPPPDQLSGVKKTKKDLLHFNVITNNTTRTGILRNDMNFTVTEQGKIRYVYSGGLEKLNYAELSTTCKTQWDAPVHQDLIDVGYVKTSEEIKPSKKSCDITITGYDPNLGGGTAVCGRIYNKKDISCLQLADLFNAQQLAKNPKYIISSAPTLTSSSSSPAPRSRLSSEPGPLETKNESKESKEEFGESKRSGK